VGSHATHLLSNNEPLNALDPRYLSLGNLLNDEFQPGDTSLHGVPVPYPGWIEQMQSCAPSLAQALRPYPQYCDSLQAATENQGKSTYQSFQAKVEKRLSRGSFLLVSYTLARMRTSGVDNIQKNSVGDAGGLISPYEVDRNWALAADDVTHTLSAALVWELPIGKGKKYLDKGGLSNAILGGWELSTIFRYSSGLPLFFRSSYCNVPGEFRAGCIPSSTGNVFAQDMGSFDPAKGPLFNVAAFTPTDAFNFNWGNGPRISDIRGFSYRNQDLSLIKNTKLFKDVNLQLRVEAFNIWNWHNFATSGSIDYPSAFNTDIAAADFGVWNGEVTPPRVIQLAVRLEF